MMVPKGRVTVRMYCHGLGDCFLSAFRRKDERPFFMLIDCGLIMGADDPESRMTRVLDSIFDETGGEIDLLVVTHEHWDHVSGYRQARAGFEKLTIHQVWQAWTEDLSNATAKRLHERRQKVREVVERAANLMPRDTARGAAFAARVEGVLEFFGEPLGAAAKVGKTKEAMDWIASRGADLQYRCPNEAIDLLPGVRALVLGPPEDEKKLKKSDPSKRKPEVYHLASHFGAAMALESALDAQLPGGEDPASPFDACYRLPVDALRANDPKLRLSPEHHAELLQFVATYYDAQDWRRIDHDWLAYAGTLALNMDSDTNNTSLALAIELSGPDGPEYLLFPGDAQVGNWLSWGDCAWDDGKIGIHHVFANTVLYKVGHHGSHNATLREEGLERMTHRRLAAMIPVDRAMARKKGWDEMPYEKLLDRLKEKTRGHLVQADEPPPDSLGPFTPGPFAPEFGRALYVDFDL